MIRATSICKSYGSLAVLQGVDLSVGQGEVVSIVGASGAGKTTLLQILGTLDRADSGRVEIDGEDVSRLSDSRLAEFRNRKIGFVFQFHNLLPEFTALENVCLPALIRGLSMREAEAAAMPILEFLGVAARAAHKPAELSGGEQQRMAVARALVNRPAVVLADEPSGNLDSSHADELHRLFFALREQYNQTFIIVTHNTELAAMADRTITIKDGKIV
ncbi:MAG: ABC transporter ATP-binding protein [Bacteroidales bacterium]|nr:ABC transporter ATP-binding protein [Bacteroidales bacterium]